MKRFGTGGRVRTLSANSGGLVFWLAFIGMLWGGEHSQGKASNNSDLQLWVALVDTTGLDVATLNLLQGEAESIYEVAGVNILWLDVAPQGEPRHFARIYLMSELPPALMRRLQVFGDGDPMALALGHSGTRSGPTIYISRTSVASLVLGGGVAEPEPQVLGRALGRVVAHELAHRFLSAGHTRRGLLNRNFSQSNLVGSSLSPLFLTDEQIDQLREIASPVRTPRESSSVVAQADPPSGSRAGLERQGGKGKTRWR